MELIIKYWPLFLEGATTTVLLSFFSVIVGVGCGTLMALARLSSTKFLSKAAKVYIDIIRGTPLLVQLYLVYFGLATVLDLNDFVSGVIAVSVNTTAYIAEIIRSGIQSVDKGQMEAGRSLGLSWWQTMRFIIIPQAFKASIPPLGNEFIAMLKDSSLVSVIGFEELMRRGQLIIAKTYAATEIWGTVAIIYLCMTIPISRLVAYLERKYNVK